MLLFHKNKETHKFFELGILEFQFKLEVIGSPNKEQVWTDFFEVFVESSRSRGWNGLLACFIGFCLGFFLGFLYRLCVYLTGTGMQFEALGARVSMEPAASENWSRETES